MKRSPFILFALLLASCGSLPEIPDIDLPDPPAVTNAPTPPVVPPVTPPAPQPPATSFITNIVMFHDAFWNVQDIPKLVSLLAEESVPWYGGEYLGQEWDTGNYGKLRGALDVLMREAAARGIGVYFALLNGNDRIAGVVTDAAVYGAFQDIVAAAERHNVKKLMICAGLEIPNSNSRNRSFQAVQNRIVASFPNKPGWNLVFNGTGRPDPNRIPAGHRVVFYNSCSMTDFGRPYPGHTLVLVTDCGGTMTPLDHDATPVIMGIVGGGTPKPVVITQYVKDGLNRAGAVVIFSHAGMEHSHTIIKAIGKGIRDWKPVAPQPVPTPIPTNAVESLDWSKARNHDHMTADISRWRITRNLRSVRIDGGNMRLDMVPPKAFPSANSGAGFDSSGNLVVAAVQPNGEIWLSTFHFVRPAWQPVKDIEPLVSHAREWGLHHGGQYFVAYTGLVRHRTGRNVEERSNFYGPLIWQ